MRRLVVPLSCMIVACHPSPSAGALSGSGILAPAAMRGMVVDGATGSGLNGANVTLIPGDTVAGAGSALSTQTAGGAFQFAAIVPGAYRVEISARGFRPTLSKVHFSPGQIRSGDRYVLTPMVECPKSVVGRGNLACP
jgi:hypothetical protein